MEGFLNVCKRDRAKNVDRVAPTFQTNGWKENIAPIVEVIQMQFFDVSSKE